MSENDRKRRSKWDNKDENQISTQISEQNAWQERESYPRHLGHDSKSYNLEPDDVMNSRDFPERLSREPSPRMRGQRNANRDSYYVSQSRRPGDVVKSYPVSPCNHGHGPLNHIRSPERTRDYPRRRSRSRSTGRGRGRSQSPSGGRNGSRSPSGGRNGSRSPSLSRGRERDRGYGRSHSPPNDYRRDLHGEFNDRRRGFQGSPPQVCRNFTAGDCRRGSQCRFLHLDNPNPRDGAHLKRDCGPRGERGASHYDVEREDLVRNRKPDVCNDFLKGRCHRGSSCRFSHDVAGENNHERQQHLAPCKFFMMGNCSRANCKFAHDAPMQDNHEMVPRDDRWNSAGNEAEKSGHHLDGFYVGGNMGWGERGIENAVITEQIARIDNDNESKKWDGADSNDVDMEIAGSEEPIDVNKIEPHLTSDSMEYQAPYEFSKPTSTVQESVLPENSQLYGQMERNTLMPQQFDTYGLPPQQFSAPTNPSDGRYVDYDGPVQENISVFKEQNSTETLHVHPVNSVVNQIIPQTMEHKPVQISNLPSMTDKFVNEQLPQLYAVLNPPKPAEAMPSNPDSGNLFAPLTSTNTQPDQTSIYQKHNSNDIEPSKVDISSQFTDFSSNSMLQNGGFVDSKTVQKPVPEERSNPVAEKPNQEGQNNGAGKVEANKKNRDGANLKDEKAMRLFKNSLVEFVKNILKPKWKEGGMSRDVHKAIVKKVVEKVTGATQGINIPSAQAKLDQYLESSRPKLAKLVEAYAERYAKTS